MVSPLIEELFQGLPISINAELICVLDETVQDGLWSLDEK
jgi:hypothetical protein